jgi:hypothetical protein
MAKNSSDCCKATLGNRTRRDLSLQLGANGHAEDAEMSAGASMSSEFGDLRLEAARRRLREVSSRDDVFEALREVVTNLLGCEEMGLFSAQTDESDLLWSFGVEARDHKKLTDSDNAGLNEVRRGEIYVEMTADGRIGGGSPHRVFIPIYAEGRVAGVLVLLKLLPQKVDFDETDMKVAMVLSHEVGRKVFAGSVYGGVRLSGDINGS